MSKKCTLLSNKSLFLKICWKITREDVSFCQRQELKMSHVGQESLGTGPKEVFDILVKTPRERLLSLTLQLCESPEETVIHALCLFVLQKEAQALNKLQSLGHNHLAEQLAEKWQLSEGKSEEFALRCAHFRDVTVDSLLLLARIFRVLSEQRLCDPHLRNLAYKRVISTVDQETDSLTYDQLREEAKVVCGPQFAEWVCSSRRELGSYRDLQSSLGSSNTERAFSLPSPLRASSSMLSFPTHLEISVPPTVLIQESKRSSGAADTSKLNTSIALVSDSDAKDTGPQIKSSEPPIFISANQTKMDDRFATESIKSDTFIAPIQTTKPTTGKSFAAPTSSSIFPPNMSAISEIDESDSTEEEEAKFYAFVIMHAPEDADMAESMRGKLENIIGSEGATFSDDFDTPGKSTLRCVEDAINNTAFTLLLLTRNFNTRMLDLETNSALINSLNKKHKSNTVIPLLPRENCMPKQSIPLVLQTIVPLEENKSFEKKILKSLSPTRIKRQEKIWTEEQKVKIQIERQERLMLQKKHRKQLMTECQKAQMLENENLMLLMKQKLVLGASVLTERDGADGMACWQQHPNIHIENAKYIMIGNDSQMTVGLAEGADKDHSVSREEEP